MRFSSLKSTASSFNSLEFWRWSRKENHTIIYVLKKYFSSGRLIPEWCGPQNVKFRVYAIIVNEDWSLKASIHSFVFQMYFLAWYKGISNCHWLKTKEQRNLCDGNKMTTRMSCGSGKARELKLASLSWRCYLRGSACSTGFVRGGDHMLDAWPINTSVKATLQNNDPSVRRAGDCSNCHQLLCYSHFT